LTATKKQFVWAILREKRTYTLGHTKYEKDIPIRVDLKTARYLKNTGLFQFRRLEEKDG